MLSGECIDPSLTHVTTREWPIVQRMAHCPENGPLCSLPWEDVGEQGELALTHGDERGLQLPAE